MKEIIIKSIARSFGITVGIALGLMTSALLAVTVSGVVNTFASGDELSSSKINENFASLKTTIESIPEWAKTPNGATYTAGNIGVGDNAHTQYRIYAYNPSGSSIIATKRGNNSDNAYMYYIPNGATSASNVIWQTGLQYDSNDYRITAWNGTGTPVYMVITNAGDIGIGHTIPGAKLAVNGEVIVSDSNTGGNAGTDLCISATNKLCKCGQCD